MLPFVVFVFIVLMHGLSFTFTNCRIYGVVATRARGVDTRALGVAPRAVGVATRAVVAPRAVGVVPRAARRLAILRGH